MNTPAATPTTAAGLLFGLQGLLAVWVGIKRFSLCEGHIQPPGFIARFELGTASRDEEQRNYDELPSHELLRFHVVILPLKR
jgi:hypothetical protein